MDPQSLDIKTRARPWDSDPGTHSGSHVGDLAQGLAEGCGFVVLIAAWAVFCMAMGDRSGWFLFGGWIVILGLAWWRGKALKSRRH